MADSRAASLRAQADAVELEERLSTDLADAKDAYRASPGDAKAKRRLDKAKRELVEARKQRRGDAGVTIGGDAVQSNGNEG